MRGKVESVMTDLRCIVVKFTEGNVPEVGSDVDVKVHKEKRSLDSNCFYWSLLTQWANYNKVSRAKEHNTMLRRYGQISYTDGTVDYCRRLDNPKVREAIDESTDKHLMPTGRGYTTKDGRRFQWYIELRGSSTYNTQEMSDLIEGLISEIKQSDAKIEVISTSELERMRATWESAESARGAESRAKTLKSTT